MDELSVVRRALAQTLGAASRLMQLVAELAPRRPGFDPMPVHMTFVANQVTLGEVAFRVLGLSPVNSIAPTPHTHISFMSTTIYVVGSKSFRPDQLFKVTEIKQLCYFST